MSILGKNWNIKNRDPNMGIADKLLANRGLEEKAQIQEYLYPSYRKGFHNPFLMKDMDKAIERIKKGVADKERILIFGDYDVDGITGTAILYHTLNTLGAKVSYRLPHRMKDGYGLSNAFVEEFARVGATLIITVDCGISCAQQIELAKGYGIDTIITDHHTIPEKFPRDAYAILHPRQPGCEYPFKGLTGAGVAFKLASALITDKYNGDEKDNYLFSLLDLASLGTVADIGPIRDENRIIVKYGLEALKDTKWVGLKYLKEQAGILPDEKMSISTIGYRISPRINAAGRIDHPYYSLQLLLNTAEEEERGKLLAKRLEKLNQDRQQMVFHALEDAEKQFLAKRSDKIFVGWNPDWHVGILGLIAGKFVEKYQVPCFIMQDFGDYLVGSVRCPEGFNAVEALTNKCEYLEHFGGHAQAAGFNIRKEKLLGFVDAMTDFAEKNFQPASLKRTLEIDCELQPDEINEGLMKFMEQMEPFGVGNEQPMFLLRNVSHQFLKRVGKEKNHLSFLAQFGPRKFSTIAYKMGQYESDLPAQATGFNMVCHLDRNEWKGRSQIQFRAVDFGVQEKP